MPKKRYNPPNVQLRSKVKVVPRSKHNYQDRLLGGKVEEASARDAARRLSARANARSKGRATPDRAAPKVDKRHRVGVEDWIDRSVWVRVKSSNVQGIRYSLPQEMLYVEFKGGGAVYVYSSVPVKVARDMWSAGSMGKFVHQRLKGRYPYAKLR